MLDFMGYGSTLILYGLLSEESAGGINTINMIGKDQTIESFLYTNMVLPMSVLEYVQFIMEAEPLYRDILKTEVQARFGLHQIQEAVEFYQNNMTSGKIILKPSLTPPVQARPSSEQCL